MTNIIKTNTEHPIEHKCYVCGRPVQRKAGRGRPKEMHTECSILASRLAEIERLSSQIVWADEAHVRTAKSKVFAIVNGPLRADRVKIDAHDDADHYEPNGRVKHDLLVD